MRKLVQHKGGLDESHEFNTEDAITSLRYSRDGQHLAIGDESGRLVVFETEQSSGELWYAGEVKAHRNSNDWTNKKEIKPSVVGLEWLERHGNVMGMVSAGLRTIKFWRFLETNRKEVRAGKGAVPALEQYTNAQYNATEIKQLPALHSGQIRHIALSNNQQSLLSTDGKTLLRWDTQHSQKPHLLFTAPLISVLPVSPPASGMEVEADNDESRESADQQREYEQSEWDSLPFITKCGFHGERDNVLGYSTKNGTFNYLDMRCTNSTKPAVVAGGKQPTQFLKRYLNVMADFAFLPGGYQLVSRDYLYGKVWDLRKPTEVVKRYSIYPSNIGKISELYDEGRLEDQFPVVLSPDGTKFLTGNYDQAFHEIDMQKNVNMRYRLNEKNECDRQVVAGMHDLDEFDPDPRITCLDYHPSGQSMCAAVRDSLFLFRSADEE